MKKCARSTEEDGDLTEHQTDMKSMQMTGLFELFK
jgi:hypothetical protein